MLVEGRVFRDGGGVQPRLVGEGRGADIGGVPVGRAVQALVEGAREGGKAAQPLGRDAGLVAELERQRRDQADEIGVAAALAQAVQRALDLPGAGADGGEAVGDGVLGVVVGVDAELLGRHDRGNLLGDRLHLVRQRAAIGVAEDNPAGAGGKRRLEAGQRIVGIGLEAVEEMLGVEHQLAGMLSGLAQRVLDHAQVLVELDTQGTDHLPCRGLRNERDDVGAAAEERCQHRVVGGASSGPTRHAEGAELGATKGLGALEEGIVSGIGAGPAALDIVDAQPVELTRDPQLVGDGEVDALCLGAVTQRGVVEPDTLARHDLRRHSVLPSGRSSKTTL